MWDHVHYLTSAPQYLQYTAIWQYAMEHCTVSHLTSYLTSQDVTYRETLGNLLQEGTQDVRVCGIMYLVLQDTAICQYGMAHCTVSHQV